jgi:hypothetical protein
MPLRKILLRVMFCSLGAAAAGGAISILLLPEQESVWRILGTALLTAGAAAVMLAASLLIDKPKSRSTGLLGFALVIIEYLLGLTLIWNMGSWRWEESVGLSILCIAATGLPAMFFLRITQTELARWAAWTGLALCALDLLLLLIGIWVYFAGRWVIDDKFAASAGALAALGPFAVASLVAVGTDRRYWRWLGVLAAAVAFALAIAHIWFDVKGDSGVFASVVALAVVVAHANLCLLVPVTSSQRWLPWATIAAALLCAATVDLLFILVPDGWEPRYDPLFRISAASAIIAGCGSLALLVLARLNRKIDFRTLCTEFNQITLWCPRCNRKQTMPIGQAQCTTCGLILRTEIEEPRCPNCDYLIYGFTSDRCPECGTPTPSDMLPTENQHG